MSKNRSNRPGGQVEESQDLSQADQGIAEAQEEQGLNGLPFEIEQDVRISGAKLVLDGGQIKALVTAAQVYPKGIKIDKTSFFEYIGYEGSSRLGTVVWLLNDKYHDQGLKFGQRDKGQKVSVRAI